jgi:hypothetical protein
VPYVARNSLNTPLVSYVFKIGQELASYETVCYVNSDIILTTQFKRAVARVNVPQYLLIGQRWGVEIPFRIDFNGSVWEDYIDNLLNTHGKMGSINAIDFFVFNRGLFVNIPDFAIGRFVWDHWLVSYALASGVPVIDATKVITAIHQKHGYEHYQGGKLFGPEYEANLSMASSRGLQHPCTVHHATWLMDRNSLRRAWEPKYIIRRLGSSRPVRYMWRLLGSERGGLPMPARERGYRSGP